MTSSCAAHLLSKVQAQFCCVFFLLSVSRSRFLACVACGGCIVNLSTYSKPSNLVFPVEGYLAELHPFHPQKHPSVLYESVSLLLAGARVIIYKQWILKLKKLLSQRLLLCSLGKPAITSSLLLWCSRLGHCICTDGERIFQPGEEGTPCRACKPGQRGPGTVRSLADRGVSAACSSGWKGS